MQRLISMPMARSGLVVPELRQCVHRFTSEIARKRDALFAKLPTPLVAIREKCRNAGGHYGGSSDGRENRPYEAHRSALTRRWHMSNGRLCSHSLNRFPLAAWPLWFAIGRVC